MFELLWDPIGYQEMQAIHDAGDGLVRHEIAQAIDTLAELLGADPASAGESRDGGRRIVFVSSFRFVFRVDEAEKTVTILSVWQFRGR